MVIGYIILHNVKGLPQSIIVKKFLYYIPAQYNKDWAALLGDCLPDRDLKPRILLHFGSAIS